MKQLDKVQTTTPIMNTYDPETNVPHSNCNNENDTSVYTKCGILAIIISGLYFTVAILLRLILDPESLPMFEYVPAFIPAITYFICGLATIYCARKPFQSSILLNLTCLLAVGNAVLSSAIAIAVIFINFRTFKAASNGEECWATPEGEEKVAGCPCIIPAYSPAFPIDKSATFTTETCDTAFWVSGICLGITALASIVAIFLSIFMCRIIEELGDDDE